MLPIVLGFASLAAEEGEKARDVRIRGPTIPVVVALNIAAAKGREQLAIGLLSGLGLLLGLAVAPLRRVHDLRLQTPSPQHP